MNNKTEYKEIKEGNVCQRKIPIRWGNSLVYFPGKTEETEKILDLLKPTFG